MQPSLVRHGNGLPSRYRTLLVLVSPVLPPFFIRVCPLYDWHIRVLLVCKRKYREKKTDLSVSRDHQVREHIHVPYDNLFQSILSYASRRQCSQLSSGRVHLKCFKFEIENLESLERKKKQCVSLLYNTKRQDSIRLTCLKALSRKVLNRLKRKASISKAISKRKTAKIFVSHFLEFSLRKRRCKCLNI